ncbi:MAG TPA: TonB-dependent receptor [Catalimonadaceae bacterium]|nr:TonB-dependent receptor [Catalimonadaceae bacterium]
MTLHIKRIPLFFFFLFLLVSHLLPAQSGSKATLSGYIKSAGDGEALIGAGVYVEELKKGATTNVYGFYSLTLPKGRYTVKFIFLGYQTQTQTLDLESSHTVNIDLAEEVRQAKEVVITGEQREVEANVKSTQMGVTKMDIKTISKIPPLLGEVDVIRSIQLLPGVSTVGEGASGFNVRGGSIDQNLILLDEAPVYNSSHLFGFFSVFNPDAVKDVKLVKGGIPAQYGGRISSLLDIRMKEGNSKKFELNGGIGLLSSRFAVEGPILKDKMSFIVAGRRTYFDLFFPLSSDEQLASTVAYFYDLTAKVNYKIDEKNTVFASGYFGRDKFGFGSAFGFEWGNSTTSLRWNHVFGSKLFSNLTAFYSKYDYALNIKADDDGFNWKSTIENQSVKPEFTWYLNDKNTITFGGQMLYYNFLPGRTSILSNGASRINELNRKYAFENSLFASNDMTVSKRLSLTYGLRYSNFANVGTGTKLILGDTTAGIKRPVRDFQAISSGKILAQFGNFEPRFSAKYELTDESSIKASYNRMAQYIHLLSNTQASVPLDVWTPSTNNIKPQIGDQVALGYFHNFTWMANEFEFSSEVFYKEMQNQIDYIDGADLLLNRTLEAELLSGKGRAYGLELYLKKRKGAFTGWISYTLSRTERQVSGINNKDWYPTRFNKTHNLYLVGSYEINRVWSASANFVFSTGVPGTFPTNRIEYQGFIIPHNSENLRNNYTLPAYHRLDISATYDPNKDSQKRWKGSWTFGIYNVYARRNPFGIYFQQTPPSDNPSRDDRVTQSTNTQAIRFSILGTLVPSVTYNFTF